MQSDDTAWLWSVGGPLMLPREERSSHQLLESEQVIISSSSSSPAGPCARPGRRRTDDMEMIRARAARAHDRTAGVVRGHLAVGGRRPPPRPAPAPRRVNLNA